MDIMSVARKIDQLFDSILCIMAYLSSSDYTVQTQISRVQVLEFEQ